jgi:hypothetical protein
MERQKQRLLEKIYKGEDFDTADNLKELYDLQRLDLIEVNVENEDSQNNPLSLTDLPISDLDKVNELDQYALRRKGVKIDKDGIEQVMEDRRHQERRLDRLALIGVTVVYSFAALFQTIALIIGGSNAEILGFSLSRNLLLYPSLILVFALPLILILLYRRS